MRDFIPYGRQEITDSDLDAVQDALRSDFLTGGPAVLSFENAYAKAVEAKYCTAVNSCTAGLHIVYQALGINENSLVWTVPATFVATANAARYLGADVDFVDIDPDNFCMSIHALERKLKAATRKPDLVVPVHLGGQSCNMKAIHALSKEYGFKIVEDAAHAVGGMYDGKPVGHCPYSEAAVFSFHPVKIITTGEGGAVTTNNESLHKKIMLLRSHGITRNPDDYTHPNPQPGYSEMQDLGLNYRLTDIQAALGHSQLKSLKDNIESRKRIARMYQNELKDLPLSVQRPQDGAVSSWHLFIILTGSADTQKALFDFLADKNIGTQVHYIPVHLHPYYRGLGFKEQDYPVSEDYAKRALSIPMFHSLPVEDQNYIISSIKEFYASCV